VGFGVLVWLARVLQRTLAVLRRIAGASAGEQI
jgi:hypothetical protein